MNVRKPVLTVALTAVLLAAAAMTPAQAAEQKFTLARAVPNDVFLYIAGQHNPEREFLDRYWDEVFEAAKECGAGEDLMDLISTLVGEEQMAEVERLKERASQLLAGVDWEQLASQETVFAERLPAPLLTPDGGIHMGPPDMVWLFRGDREGAAHNFDGLTAILEGIVEEINNALGAEALAVEKTERMGSQVASANLLAMMPQSPKLTLAVAQHDDIILIAMGDQILQDVLGLLDESGSKTGLANDQRFKGAFAKLPAAEDGQVFFDMQAMLRPLRQLADSAIAASQSQDNVYVRTESTGQGDELTAKAIAAYTAGNIEDALEYSKQAHEAAPKDCIPLYNLACFNALSGHKEEALGWLEKAVDAGFCAPQKIASDSDLESLRDTPRFKAALAKAKELATLHAAEDVTLNSPQAGEVGELCTKAWEVYEQKDYEQGLQLVEQAFEKDPNDSRVLYYLACFHALLGHKDKALSFLTKAVDGGFYCPGHISRDPDLESIRDDARYEAALTKAREKAADIQAQHKAQWNTTAQQLTDRIAKAVGILDYVASVESTDGYSVHKESIAALVSDAEQQPIYPVFAKRGPQTDFDKFLPEETLSFSICGGIDLGELYKFILDTVRAAGPPGEELLAKWAAVQKSFDVDVSKDVLGWIDGRLVSVTLEDGKGSVWLIKVTDEDLAREKVSAAVEFLSEKLTEVSSQNPMLAMLSLSRSPTKHDELEGFEDLRFVMSPQPIVWGVAEGHLILGNSADAVAICLKTAMGEHPNIRKNKRAMAEAIVPDGPFASCSLTDRRHLGQEIAQGLAAVSMVSGMAGAMIPAPEARPIIGKIATMLSELTPVAEKIDFYKSASECTTFDGHAWRTHKVTHYFSPAERAEEESS
jgi:tetratricopeptide (TPR) repeat protein